MPRARKGAARKRAHKRLLKAAKGFVSGRHRLYRTAVETLRRARRFAYRDRKRRKQDFRRLWIIRINAAAKAHGLSYSQFMHGLAKADVDLDRKVLAEMAVSDPEAFGKLAALAKEKVA
ncbi:MAG: 50S ribosomal protein L20 [Planctomycetota bacterium]